jgi:cyanate lyase
MTKQEMSAVVLAAKKAKDLTWAHISEALELGPVYLASCCHGENSMDPPAAAALGKLLDLDAAVVAALTECPSKGWTLGEKPIPTDPLIYRFYEIMAVYGTSMKSVIHEMFGDGIMSAIDFKLDIDRKEDPKGVRVVVTMDGKFLPYKRW